MIRLLLPLCLCLPFFSVAQMIQWEELSPMPERVSNNALTMATVAGVPYVYSFSGIDSTKSCDGDHLRSFRYNTQTDVWEAIADLPDALGGKIAAGASTVKNKIYIVGGYHLASNCGETSSQKIHIYDPETNAYEADGAPLLKAIDDQIQVVWRDSLIYVISGWSNTANVTDVQIYNPSTDEWVNGTPVPATTNWRVFGASGTIIGDTIYFAGGAANWNGNNFPPTSHFRKGAINPDNPAEIVWEDELSPMSRGYRMGASDFEGKAVWFGGSNVTYNFDGIAYNGTGGVEALDRISFYDPITGVVEQLTGDIPAIMDLRGVAKISENEFILAGGMRDEQEVTNRVYKIQIDQLTDVEAVEIERSLFFPNPVREEIIYKGEKVIAVECFDALGRLVWQQELIPGMRISTTELDQGIYFLHYKEGVEREMVQKIIVQD